MHLHVFDTLATRRAQRSEHQRLVDELAAFSSHADRLEIESVADRYSDEESREVRAILDSLAA
jgi:hypothetical protein